MNGYSEANKEKLVEGGLTGFASLLLKSIKKLKK